VRPWQLVFYPGHGAAWSVATAVFMHGGWVHLLGNLLYFHVFGPPLEDRLGHVRFLVYFLLLGVGGNLAHGFVSLLGWFGQAGTGVLGASGAIAGVISFCLVRFYDARVEVGWWVFAPLGGQNRAGRTPVPIFVAVVLWLILQVTQTYVATEVGSATSLGAHFGGFFMGLLLALAMGQLKPARDESILARAQRYFRAGNLHAAAGEWAAYLERRPDDEKARLCAARTNQALGQFAAASVDFRRVFRDRVGRRDAAGALDVYRELDRGAGGRVLAPSDLAKVAYYFEKQGDYGAAVDAYKTLYRSYPHHPEGHRALVRIVVLLHGKAGRAREARRFLDEARHILPAGSGWREFLEREFKWAAGDGGVPAAGPAATLPRR
jgi:membrane associated rhomboid family serine protease